MTVRTSRQAPAPGRVSAVEVMRAETRVRYGSAPRSLLGEPLKEMSWQMLGEQFLLRGEGDHYFFYERGSGITVERGERFDASEETLWLNGSVYSAIASINGFMPIHASAVAHDGRVYAFAAEAGGGKSTLIAALANHGLPMFCDDTLVLDISAGGPIICLPGHKRLKLCPDAVELTGAARAERVSETVDKFYARPAAGSVDEPMPLAELIFIEEGPGTFLQPIRGSAKLLRLQADHQTAHVFEAARRFSRHEAFANLADLARRVRMSTFVRPRDKEQFASAVELVAHHIANVDS